MNIYAEHGVETPQMSYADQPTPEPPLAVRAWTAVVLVAFALLAALIVLGPLRPEPQAAGASDPLPESQDIPLAPSEVLATTLAERTVLGSGDSAVGPWELAIRTDKAHLTSGGYCIDVSSEVGYCTENTDGRFVVAFQTARPALAVVQVPPGTDAVEAHWDGGTTGKIVPIRPFSDAAVGIAALQLPDDAEPGATLTITRFDREGREIESIERSFSPLAA